MPVVTALKAVTVNVVKAVAKDVKDVMASAAKAVMAAAVATAAASVRVNAQANATSAQKAHRQKRVNLASRVKPAPRAKAGVTNAKVSAKANAVVIELVIVQSARRVNAVRP
jgi:hypothetical protein